MSKLSRFYYYYNDEDDEAREVISIEGSVVTFNSKKRLPLDALIAHIDPVQNLHGYDNPWPAGGGKNGLLPLTSSYTQTTNEITITYDANTEAFSLSGTNAKTDSAWLILNTSAYTLRPLSSGTTYYFAHNLPSGTYGQITYNKTGGGVAVLAYLTGNDSFNKVSFTLPENFDSVAREQIGVLATTGTISASGIHFGVYAENPTAWSPYSNICPITGWTGAKVTKAGKNLANMFNDGKVPSISNGQLVTANGYRSDFIPFKANAAFTFHVTGAVVYIMCYDKDKNFLSVFTNNTGTISNTTPANTAYVMLRKDNNTAPTDAQLEVGSTATAYESYQADTYEIAFPTEAGTVYGGTLDVTNGTLTVDRVSNVLNGTQELGDNGTQAYGGIQVRYVPSPAKKLADTTATQNSGLLSDKFSTSLAFSDSAYQLTGRSTNANVYINMPPTITTAAQARAWFVDNPTQVIYELATPTTYQLTPQEVRTLLGTNNIWADTGDVSVKYVK